jgi:hypothetical protein
MRGLGRLVKREYVLIAVFSGLLANLVLNYLWIAIGEPVATIIWAVVNATWLGVCVFWLVRTLREIGRELGVICFENGRCVALDDIALIYIEPHTEKALKTET